MEIREISQARFDKAAELLHQREYAKEMLVKATDLAHKRMWKMLAKRAEAERRKVLGVV